MNEIELLQRAKVYLDKLANGIDPLTDRPVRADDVINNVKISRCLFFVANVIRQVIDNGGINEFGRIELSQPNNPTLDELYGKKNKGNVRFRQDKEDATQFTITQEELKEYTISTTPISASEIARRINDLIKHTNKAKLNYKSISSYLLQCGLLKTEQTSDGHTVKVPTEQGMSIGITSVKREELDRSYYVTVYNADAQQFILDNIDGIIEISNLSTERIRRKKQEQAEQAVSQGQPWTREKDAELVDLFNKKMPISSIAKELKRTDGAIRARLKKLGLVQQG